MSALRCFTWLSICVLFALPMRSLDDEQKAKKGEDAGKNAEKKEKPDSEKSPKELLEEMDKALAIRPKKDTPEERKQAITEAFNIILTKADAVVKHPKATAAELREAYEFQISVFAQGTEMGFDEFPKKLGELAGKLKAGKHELAATAGYHALVAKHRTPAGVGPAAFPDVEAFLADFPGEQSAIRLLQTIGLASDFSGKPADARKAFEMLIKHFPDDPAAAEAKGAIKRIDLVGKPLSITGLTLAGQTFDPAELKGKIVLVDFWATWCGPCIAEMPHLAELYKKYHDQGLEIVGISLDKEREDLEKFLEEKKVPWFQLVSEKKEKSAEGLAEHPMVRDFGIMAIPAMFLVGKDGKVISSSVRPDELDATLEKLFPEKK